VDNNRIVVLGANGQDGFLATVMGLEQGYEVLAISRHADPRLSKLSRRHHLLSIKVHKDYLKEFSTLEETLREFNPSHVLYLASSQGPSGSPISKAENNWMSIEVPTALIKWARVENFGLTLPLSSRMFSGHLEGKTGAVDIDLSWPTKPNDAYGAAKVTLMELCSKARDDGVFIHSPVLFNHDSIFKKSGYVGSAAAEAVASFFSPDYKYRIANPLALLDVTDAVSVVGDMLRMMHTANSVTILSSGLAFSVEDIVAGEVEFLRRILDLNILYPKPLGSRTGKSSACLISSVAQHPRKVQPGLSPNTWLSLMGFSRLTQNRFLPVSVLPPILKNALPKTFWDIEPAELHSLTPA
jgi:GDP-D-mannose dehydratase